MSKLNTKNFTTSKDHDEIQMFVSRAVFAFTHIKENRKEMAKRDGKDAYQFAKDNEAMEVVDFGNEASALIK